MLNQIDLKNFPTTHLIATRQRFRIFHEDTQYAGHNVWQYNFNMIQLIAYNVFHDTRREANNKNQLSFILLPTYFSSC